MFPVSACRPKAGAGFTTEALPVPVNTVRPAITSDGLSDGDTQHGSNGTWSNTPTGYTYQWYYALLDTGEPVLVDGIPVSDGDVTGATSIDYDWVVANDDGKWAFLGVVASNSGGAGAEAFSDAIGPMANAATMPSGVTSALQAWYKADVGLTLSGADITAAADQSGNGRDCNNLGFGSPNYNATGFNGGPGIEFGTADSLSSSAFNLNSNVTTYFLVVNFTSPGGDNRVLSYSHSGVGGSYNEPDGILAFYTPDSTSIGYLQNSAGANATIAASTNYRFILVLDGTNETLYVNGVQQAQSSSTVTIGNASSQITLGKGDDVCPTMVVAEWGVTNADNTADVVGLDAYLKSKWGL